MKGYVDGIAVALEAKNRIGGGGEGNVFAWDIGGGKHEAIKIYHNPKGHSRKLQAMIADPPAIVADRGTLPLRLVTDDKGAVIGFTMRRIGSGYEDLSQLSSKKYRDAFRPTTWDVSGLFLDGYQTVESVHASGYVIGDFNDFNEKFEGASMLFLDVDAWQFGPFPCPVGAEQFLAPRLYGIDLSLAPVFERADDWYSYAVLLFKSLLNVHPYGGVHRKVRQLTDRAQQRITVFDSGVTYPSVGMSPDILTDDLAAEFAAIFKHGARGTFHRTVLEAYRDALVTCPSCGSTYPSSRPSCPVCSAVQAISIKPITLGVTVKELFRVDGTILFSKWLDDKLYLVVNEKGRQVEYQWSAHYPTPGVSSPARYNPGTRYEVVQNMFVYNSPHDNMLLFSNGKALETDIFSGTRSAMFRSTGRFLLRIAAGYLMAGEFHNGLYVERPIRPVSSGQTWFTARQDNADKPTICGFFQVFHEQIWWLYFEGLLYDNLKLTPLELGESQIDVLVRIDASGALIKRVTQQAGVNYLHTAYVSSTGSISNSLRRKFSGNLPHGALYAHGALLSATDDGLVQEKLTASRTFDQTKGIIEEGDTLYEVFGNALLVVKQDRILQVQLG